MKIIKEKTIIQYLINEIKLAKDRIDEFNKTLESNVSTDKHIQFSKDRINDNEKIILSNRKKIDRIKKRDNTDEYNICDFNLFYKLINNNHKMTNKEYNEKWKNKNQGYYKKYYENKVKNNLIHCDICDKNIVSQYFNIHLFKKRHIDKKLSQEINKHNLVAV